MKKNLLILLALFLTANTFAQISNAKLQWSRKQLGLASDNETTKQAYRDPASGNIFVMYQGYYNFGVARFDNSGANTGNYKHLAPMAGYSAGGKFKYLGNNELIVAAYDQTFNSVIKFNMSGNLIWQYKEATPAVFATYFYNRTATSIATDQNNDILFTSSHSDSAMVSKLNSSGQFIWNKTYHPTGYDAGLYSDVVTDNFNNIVGCGIIRNTAGSNFDGFIVSYDANGNKNWEHLFAGAANDMDSVSQILMDNSGNSYIGGYVRDSSSTNRTLFVAKYNASGGIQFYKKFHVPLQSDARFGGITLDGIGNLYLTGSTFDAAGTTASAWIVKYSSTGNELWSFNYDSPAFLFDIAEDISTDQLGNVYATGTVHNNIFGVADEFLLKLTGAGTYQWLQLYNHPNNLEDRAEDLLVDNSGNSFIVGVNASYLNYNSNVTINKFSASGNLQWEGFFDSPGNLTDNAIKIIRDGSHAVYTLSNIENNTSNSDVAITKYNAKGVLLWQIMYDNASVANNAYGMHMDAQKNIYVLVGANGGYDTKLLKYDSLGTQIWENYYSEPYYTISGDANGNIYLAGGQYGYTDISSLLVDNNGTTQGSHLPSILSPGFNRTICSTINSANELYVFSIKDEYPISHLNISKFNSSANLMWTKDIYNLDSINYGVVWPREIQLDGNGNLYAIANAKDYTLSNSFIYLLKFDANGNQLWETKYNDGDAVNLVPTDLEIDNYNQVWTTSESRVQKFNPTNGSLYFEKIVALQMPIGNSVNGYSLIKRYSANELFMSSSITLSNGKAAIALTKLDSSGNYIWHSYYMPQLETGGYAADMTFDYNGRIYLHCNSFETEGSLPDVVTLKFCDVAVPPISAGGPTTNICPGNPVTITTSNAVNYQWFPNGELTPSVQADSTGNYYALGFHTDGCFQSTDTIAVSLKAAPVKPDVCVVTVDSLSTHNIIYWDKTNFVGLNIDRFKIYREDVTNLYSYIGFTDFDSLSEFHDYDFLSNPNVTTKRYKITAVDTCNQESAMSDYHNTIYIVSNGNGQFSWNLSYTIENQSNPVNNYVLMRDGVSNGNWTQVGITAGSQQNINDVNYSSFPNGRWRVETIWGISCDPSRSIINTSRSNIKAQLAVIGVEENENTNATIYPNPASNSVNVSGVARGATVKLIDVLGRELFSEKSNSANINLNLENIAQGIYFLRIYSESGKLMQTKKLEVMK